ncbi:MAG TPA: hypothetical protein VFT43_00305, partial [Candidatus Polarisedimenticolia bacterium]|nr:hypothetical protein [Candidatus Polarisedimenticolia bacterium]
MTESLRRGLLDALKICLMGACLLLVPAHPGEAETLATEALTCPSCDDFNACTIDSCDTTNGTCRHDPRSCDDHNPCTADSCDPRPEPYGGCRRAFLPTGSTCDDGNACSSNDACDGAGTCVGVAQAAGSACDDGNPCTGSDACSDAGLCGGTPLAPGTECDDHDACTSGERCALVSGAVVCQGNVKNCDDGALCTEDRCDPITGQCVNAPVACDDGNSCTLDACDPATGACTHGNTTGSCEDGNFCSVNDYCSGGNCLSGGPRDCGQPQCGSYFCRPDLQICQFNDSSGPSCPAAPQCNYYVCVNGSCQLNQQPSRYPCSDGNPCTVEYCVRGDCQLQLFRSGQSCDDGSLCTLNDVCNGFNCTGTPKCD